MSLPFEPDLEPPEDNRDFINCQKCGTKLYYETDIYEQYDCYYYRDKFYCEDCIADIVKKDTYFKLA